MDYYEELGLTKSATDEEVHKAHRRLVRLLHPDQHTDGGLKALAETQLRRLNGIVKVLSTPESRLQYDREQTLERAAQGLVRFGAPVFVPQPFFARRANNRNVLIWALCSALAAMLFTLCGVWWVESRAGSLFGYSVQAYNPESSESLNAVKDFKPPPPGREAEALEGNWVYVANEQENHSGSYLPESIALRLVVVNGKLQGEYRARYAVKNRAIPSDVNFTLAASSGDDNDLRWRNSGGAQGTFKILQISGDRIRTSWETSVYTRDSVLTTGAATLARRNY